MSPLFKLAFRNVRRSRARSALTAGAIGLGIMMSLILGAFIHGLHAYLVDDTVRGRVGALQVHRAGYFEVRDRQSLSLDFPVGGELEAQVLAAPGVAAVTPRIAFTGLVSNGTTATVFMGNAVDPVGEARVLPLAQEDVEGTRLGRDTPRHAVMGQELAAGLGLGQGDDLTLQATTQGGRENALDLQLAGTRTGQVLAADKRKLNVPLGFAQELLQMEGRATELVVALDEGADVDQVAQALRERVGAEYEVHTWVELRPSIRQIINLQRGVLLGIAAICLLIAIIGVVNTLLMSVMERTREIGTMMAVGVRRGRIAKLFVLEAAFQALIGSLLGVASAWALVALFAADGGLVFALGETGTMTLIPAIAPYQVAIAVGASALGAVLAAFWPAMRAASLRPVEALRQ